ncbi:MAG: response regulator transcription factor [Rhodospirillales bacterium]
MSAHIVIVEDEVLIQDFLRHCLEGEGYTLTCLDTGMALLQFLDHTTPDLIVLDLGLPDEDGIVILRQIQARQHYSVIILTAREDEASRMSCLEIGVEDFLQKNVTRSELTLRVRNVLRRVTGATQPVDARVAKKAMLDAGYWSVDTAACRVIGNGGGINGSDTTRIPFVGSPVSGTEPGFKPRTIA